MSFLPPLTKELTLRLERHIARGVVLDPDGATYAIFGQTVCSKSRSGRPRNKVFAFSREDMDLLPKILAYYGFHKIEATFYLSPAGFCGEVGAALASKGFVQREFEQAILYGLPDPTLPTLPAEMSIEPVTRENHSDYVATLAAGHEWDAAWRDAAMKDVAEKFAAEPAEITARRLRFLARIDGEPAGVGAIELRDGIASVAMGATVPKFRRRGVHTALLRHRLHLAHQLGAELVLSAANFGSGSFRNQQRLGLQLAYIEAGWRR
jgi:GNAT superfamily N-acetyltransferase